MFGITLTEEDTYKGGWLDTEIFLNNGILLASVFYYFRGIFLSAYILKILDALRA